MQAMKEALKRKMQEHQSGKKPALEVAIGIGKPKPDLEQGQDGMTEGDALEMMDKKKLQEENDLAPESNEDESQELGIEQQEGSKLDQLLGHESSEDQTLQQILQALADRSPTSGRGPMGLAERAAVGAKGKLGMMKKA